MKIDRLLGIVIYLLNRDIVSASTLAERFEVSTRTIQRDIESLNLAGIPVTALQGKDGGYGILDSFRLDKQIATAEDYLNVITALKAMGSAYDSRKLDATLEKVIGVSGKNDGLDQRVKLDFGVSREVEFVDENLKMIDKAVGEKHAVEFEYTNANGNKSIKQVEPVGVVYQWYAWYMLAYCLDRKAHGLFKLTRVRKLRQLDTTFTMVHESLSVLLEEQRKQEKQDMVSLKAKCNHKIKVLVQEHFANARISDLYEGEFLLEACLPDNELGWKGILFSFGGAVVILEPESLKQEFLCKAQEIMSNYI